MFNTSFILTNLILNNIKDVLPYIINMLHETYDIVCLCVNKCSNNIVMAIIRGISVTILITWLISLNHYDCHLHTTVIVLIGLCS